MFAAQGVNLGCLANGLPMNSSTCLPVGASYVQVRAAHLTCGAAVTHRRAYLLLTLLLVLHFGLLVLPLVGIARFARSDRRRAPLLYTAMAVFSLASLGEIALHIHDNWVYVTTLPTFYNVVFHSGLTAGQLLAAAALLNTSGVWGVWTKRLMAGSALLGAAGLFAGVQAAVASGIEPGVTESPPNVCLNGTFAVQWVCIFAGLSAATAAFLWAGWEQAACVQPAPLPRLPMTISVIGCYAAGIVFAHAMTSTGEQWWHVPTALSFVLAFSVQLWWIDRTLLPAEHEHEA